MKLESYGILIGMRPLNERDAVAQVFTQDFGVMVGVMRGAVVAKKNKPLVGQVGAVSWNARLDSQLGTFHWEAERNLAAGLLVRPRALAEMNAAFGLLAVLLPERECYGTLYDDTYIMLNDLNAGSVTVTVTLHKGKITKYSIDAQGEGYYNGSHLTFTLKTEASYLYQ